MRIALISEPEASAASFKAQEGLEGIDYRWEQQEHSGRTEALHAVAALVDLQ